MAIKNTPYLMSIRRHKKSLWRLFLLDFKKTLKWGHANTPMEITAAACEGNVLPFMDYCRSKEKVEIPFYGEMNRGLDI